MKKFLSLTLAVLMVASAFVMSVGAAMTDGVWHPDNKKWDAISKDGVVARFAIGGDIHFQYYNAGEKNAAAYNAFKQIGGVDAYLIAGDLTHYGHDDEYTSLMASVNAGTKKNDINPGASGDSVGMTILAMGNHEYGILDPSNPIADPEARFTEYTAQQPDALYWIKGIPVIKLSPDNMKNPRSSSSEAGGGCYDASEQFLKDAYAEIDAKGYNGLIIMFAHHRPSVEGNEGTSAWPQSMLDMMKAHPNTMIFTGHSHTWIGNTKYFILQDAGFTHVRAGSLGNDYGGLGSGYINDTTGKTSTPLAVAGDSNCSCVLVDIMADGSAKLRRMDIAKGEYMFEDEDFIVKPGVLTDYLYDDETAGWDKSYGAGSQKPSFPADAKITVEDAGNHSSVVVKFPEAVPATSLAKDFVAEYRIRLKTPALDENGNVIVKDGKTQYTYLKNGDKDYFRVANYRGVADEGKDWEVNIHGLTWNTDYTVEVRALTSYGKATSWTAAESTINVGEGTPNYPAVPVIDFDYSYGSAADGAGHKLVVEPTVTKDAEINGQQAVNFLGIGGKPWAYEFTEEDFFSIKDFFVMEAYFSATNVTQTQCIMGAWDASNLGFKIDGGKLHLWAAFAAIETSQEARNVVSADIEANTWYHAVAVYNGLSAKLYINGELVDENTNAKGGLDTVSYVKDGFEDDPEAPRITKNFAVAAGEYSEDKAMYTMQNCKINKAALYSGVMTDEDVKTAYKIATTALPFTDVTDGWYIDSVEYAYATGLMNGSSATTFSPSVKTNRAMIVQMLYNLEGKPVVDKTNNPFTDVADTWYTDAVLWAYQSGVTTGTSATTFAPDALVTREQVAVFLYRYMRDYKKADLGDGADLSSYPDADAISPYTDFAPAVSWANANGIIGGKKNGSAVTLSPLDQAMRSEVAKMFVSFAKKY
ncbi:MAG: S-layer homology domain-containing protein [Clostridia bacterium]|nr:S-layer homology domain-containing protein [Clostridia bacterium]